MKGGDETAKNFPGSIESKHRGPEVGDACVTGEMGVKDP